MEWPKTFNELTGIKNPTIIYIYFIIYFYLATLILLSMIMCTVTSWEQYENKSIGHRNVCPVEKKKKELVLNDPMGLLDIAHSRLIPHQKWHFKKDENWTCLPKYRFQYHNLWYQIKRYNIILNLRGKTLQLTKVKYDFGSKTWFLNQGF